MGHTCRASRGDHSRKLLSVLPETQVTFYSGDMGDTLPPEEGACLGRSVTSWTSVCGLLPACSTARNDRRSVRIRDLPEDGLQDFDRYKDSGVAGADRPQSPPVPARESAADDLRTSDRPAEEATTRLGRTEDPREPARRCGPRPLSRDQYRPCGVGSAWPGAPPPRRRRATGTPLSRATTPMRSGAPISKASFYSGIGATATR